MRVEMRDLKERLETAETTINDAIDAMEALAYIDTENDVTVVIATGLERERKAAEKAMRQYLYKLESRRLLVAEPLRRLAA